MATKKTPAPKKAPARKTTPAKKKKPAFAAAKLTQYLKAKRSTNDPVFVKSKHSGGEFLVKTSADEALVKVYEEVAESGKPFNEVEFEFVDGDNTLVIISDNLIIHVG